ncbi:ATP-grasp domain-containing protein [Arenibaculum sp.]|uniref:ATP-grasp domain-containing protein n=1 Tax=Arenibaculum sp. TaxID=2865862 RepID=UPI002E13594A|nr:ATP-grasp domain-containing protein [Arenibaculum sp.]
MAARRHIVLVDANYWGLNLIPAAKRLGYRVTFVRSRDDSKYPEDLAGSLIPLADAVIEVPVTAEEEALEGALRDAGKAQPVDGAVTFLDVALEPLATVAERLGIPFTARGAVATVRRKDHARAALERAGIAGTAYGTASDLATAREVAARVGYPLFLKPAAGTSSLMAARVDDEAALERAFAAVEAGRAHLGPLDRLLDTRTLLLERRLEGPLVSVELGVAGGRSLPFMVSGRKRAQYDEAMELGATMPAQIDEATRRDVVDHARTAVEALGLDLGLFHVEVIVTPEGPRLLEANARLMGALMPLLYRNLTGADIYESAARIHVGDPADPPAPPPGMAAVSRCIASRHDAVVARAPDLAWLDDHREHLRLFRLKAEPGQVVRAYAGSQKQQIFGFLQVAGEGGARMEALADAIVARLSEELGIELAT